MGQVTESRRSGKPLPPATGWCRWLDSEANGNPRLRITTVLEGCQDYEVEFRRGDWRLYRLDPVVGVVRYIVTPMPWTGRNGVAAWSCDCPDAIARPERRLACKHVRALRAALKEMAF